MKLKNIIPIVLAIGIGFLMGNFLLNQYDRKEPLKTTFQEKRTVYFMQQGVYSSQENMEKNTTNLSNYIYTIENGKYYVYIGMTGNEKNLEKLKGYFKDIGYIIYVKEITLSNLTFLEVLSQYDQMLEKTEERDTIQAIQSQIISKYEELVVTE